jgi:uncharacterized protein (TIGR02265 family)
MPLRRSSNNKTKTQATIKGVFVQSHVRALRERAGDQAVEELARRFGAPVRFAALQDVPVRDEVRIIELTLDLMSEHGLVGPARAEAAGRLHLTNFSRTTLGSMLLNTGPRTPKGFISLLMSAPTIARSVFAGSNFNTKEHQDCLVVTIDNCDYPPEHFAGFFNEWMRVWGLEDSRTEVHNPRPGTYEYRLYFSRAKN